MNPSAPLHDVIIVGAGAAGIATAASLLKRAPNLDVLLIDPATEHFYQPGWTLVGAGVFSQASTRRETAALVPAGATLLRGTVTGFDPEHNRILLAEQAPRGYRQLVVCPGLKLDWAAIDGLEATLGRHGVTSNYRYDLAPYTWELTRALQHGRALFTQPGMPIKCAGAPQKALYLACDHWRRHDRLGAVQAEFLNANPSLFGVAAYVPALQRYIERYQVDLRLRHRLVAVDGPAQEATFEVSDAQGNVRHEARPFDMLHVVPPQCAPDALRGSALADAAGWLDVDPHSLRHRRFANIHGLGDAINAGNAKTVAAARKQAPVVAHNVAVALGRAQGQARYDGYGACPLTVERGRIVLAEFAYGGQLAPSFPQWLLKGTEPTRLAWWLKAHGLPWLYWNGMLRGHEWLARPVLADSP
ncbi:FAD/NAD(P)-binding oxidoreductase [Pseudomonas sp. RIT-PI-S]|uniref:NAD(P)/FAD-dependent oxidoreductase n=1 Tax=Pseudomonas sp. RIT-PI-S TaxID=3035295 RepID=UPI0021DB5021|nr:FAD/NAD(P)-binding oxidoreductase [Pseudomonas sp. RIT-PI-S]